MPRLVVNPASPSAWEIQLKPGANLIGRALTNHFQIRDPSVSGTHCQILVDGHLAQIKDFGSTNGTFVNHRQVTEAALEPGCSIRLGEVELQFCADTPFPLPAISAGAPLAAVAVETPAAPGFEVPPPQAAETATLPTGAPPPGTLRPLQRCRFHPAMPARFVCSRCGHCFCEACVATRGTEKFCRHCGIPCAPVQVQYQTVVAQSFFRRVPGAFLYPLRGTGVIIVIVGIVLVGLLKGSSALLRYGTLRMIIFGVILAIFAGGYLFSYLQGIVHSTTAEDRELPDLPGISNFLEDVIVPFFRFLALTLFCFAPAIGSCIWMLASHKPEALYVLLGTTALGYLYFPMAFLAVAVLDSIMAANPLLVVPSILKAPVKYVISLMPLACMSAVQWFGERLLSRLFPEGWTTHEMGLFLIMIGLTAFLSFLCLYLLIVALHLLGLIFVTTREELAWHER